MIDTVVEVHHVIVVQIAKIHHKIDIALSLSRDQYRYDRTTTPPQFNRSRYDNSTIDEIHVPIVHHTDLHTDHHINKIHAIDINHVPTLEIDNFHNELLHIDLLLNCDSLDLLDLDQTLKQEIKSITFKQNNRIHLLILKSICTILQKWLML